jgi:asparagine synthase (glutamine-hydrolysing)
MTCNTDSLVLGKSRFNDSSLKQTASREGVETAWRQAFQRFGTKAPEQVSGDFSVALRLPDGRTFLAIDRFAIRSLCYRQVGNHLLFAERADQLADSTTEIDPQAIFDYLYTHAIPSPRTIYKGIYRVPPAHYVLFENSQLTVAPYWTPAFTEVSPPPFDQLTRRIPRAVATSHSASTGWWQSRLLPEWRHR